MQRQMHLNLFILGKGHHEAAWRHPGASRLPPSDIAYYQALALAAERGLFDSVFIADVLASDMSFTKTGHVSLEPLTMLGALAASTSQIGLIGTVSTTYTEPYNLARQFASLDHISKGRIGWNIVTTWSILAAQNFGGSEQIGHSERYDRADEFMSVVKALWDSWTDDAIVADAQSGLFAHEDRIRPINHRGENYSVAGPLNLPRSPQGHPVLVQAGSSDKGRRFAARHAEAIFTAHLEKSTALAFYADLKALVAAEGRNPDHALVLPGLSALIASTESEAKRMSDELNMLADPEIGRKRLSGRFGGYDFSHLPLDKVLSVADFPDPSTVEAARSRTEVIVGLVARERITLRQLLARLAGARGHLTVAGTPEQVADLMEDWFRTGAADGFNIMPPILPAMLDVFISEVVPILQHRGLFRTSYEGNTLREKYGLPRPRSR